MEEQVKGERGPYMAVNEEGYKKLSFEGPEIEKGCPQWSGDRKLTMKGPLSPLLVPSMVCPLFPLYGGCSLPVLSPQSGDTYSPDHPPPWRVPFPLSCPSIEGPLSPLHGSCPLHPALPPKRGSISPCSFPLLESLISPVLSLPLRVPCPRSIMVP